MDVTLKAQTTEHVLKDSTPLAYLICDDARAAHLLLPSAQEHKN